MSEFSSSRHHYKIRSTNTPSLDKDLCMWHECMVRCCETRFGHSRYLCKLNLAVLWIRLLTSRQLNLSRVTMNGTGKRRRKSASNAPSPVSVLATGGPLAGGSGPPGFYPKVWRGGPRQGAPEGLRQGSVCWFILTPDLSGSGSCPGQLPWVLHTLKKNII